MIVVRFPFRAFSKLPPGSWQISRGRHALRVRAISRHEQFMWTDSLKQPFKMTKENAMKREQTHDSTFLQFSRLDSFIHDEQLYVLVVLNYQMPLITPLLWSKASFHICADGGANQLYDSLPKMCPCDDLVELRKKYKPDVIKGDLDSVRPEVRTFYEGLGTKVVDESDDQDTTDLHKCISYIVQEYEPTAGKEVKILVVGGLGGRLDHEFGNLNVLHTFPTTRIILLSDESMARLLSKDFRHKIHVDTSIEGPHCGLIPLGAPSISTTTTGLRWNLNETAMEFGGLISVCNQVEGKTVTVTSDANLVWTITIEQLKKRLQAVPNE